MASGHEGLPDDLLLKILVFAVDGTTTGKTGPFPVSKSLNRILNIDARCRTLLLGVAEFGLICGQCRAIGGLIPAAQGRPGSPDRR